MISNWYLHSNGHLNGFIPCYIYHSSFISIAASAAATAATPHVPPTTAAVRIWIKWTHHTLFSFRFYTHFNGWKKFLTRWFFSFFVRFTANVLLMIYTKNSSVWLNVFLTIENFPVGLKIDLYYWMRSNADRFSFRKLNCASKIKNEDFAWKLSNPCCDNDAHESFDTVWIVYWRTRWMCIIEPSKFMHLLFTGIQFRDALALNLRLVVRLKLIIMISKTALHILSMFISTSDGDDQQLIKRRYIVKRFIGSY